MDDDEVPVLGSRRGTSPEIVGVPVVEKGVGQPTAEESSDDDDDRASISSRVSTSSPGKGKGKGRARRVSIQEEDARFDPCCHEEADKEPAYPRETRGRAAEVNGCQLCIMCCA